MDNASLPRVAHGRKKVGLTVPYSGFAAFGHPARQGSFADRRARHADTRRAHDAPYGGKPKPADAPLKDDRKAHNRLVRFAPGREWRPRP